MISLTDAQLDIVMNAARDLPPEKRNVFLERVIAVLQRRGRFNDADVGSVHSRQPAACCNRRRCSDEPVLPDQQHGDEDLPPCCSRLR